MSVSSKKRVLERIESATTDSPIAVFRTLKIGAYNAVFADTLYTQSLIQRNDKALIGVYYGLHGCDQFVEAIKGEEVAL